MKCNNCKKTIDVTQMNLMLIKTNEKNKFQICLECENILDGNISVYDISISKGQAQFLIKYHNFMDSPECNLFIKENWGTLNHFKSMCFSLDPNQLSLAINFLQIKELFQQTFSKEDFEYVSKFYISHFEDEFNSWEQFLDLLGEDPRYKSPTKTLDSITRNPTIELVDRFIENKDALNDRAKRKIKFDMEKGFKLKNDYSDVVGRARATSSKAKKDLGSKLKREAQSKEKWLKKQVPDHIEKLESLNMINRKKFEEENNYNTDEELLELVIKKIEYNLRDSPESLKKFKTVIEFVDMLESQQLKEINNSIQ